MPYPRKVNLITKTLNEHKAEDVEVINVKNLTPFAEYYVLATAPNVRALGALADYVDNALEEEKDPIKKIDGKPVSEWVIVNCGEVLVHLFTSSKREEISLKGLLEKMQSKNH